MTYQYSDFQFDGDLDSIRSAIEDALGFRLSERESSYWGGIYYQFSDDTSDFRLRLHRNIDHTGECINPEFKGSHVVCSVSGRAETVSAFVDKMLSAGGLLLATSTREIDDE